MNKSIIVYFGIISYETENAMCRRAEGINKLTCSLGYNYVEIGVATTVHCGRWEKWNDNKYVIHYPVSTFNWIRSCLSSKEIRDILNDIGVEKIKTLIMADYRFLPMAEMNLFCRKYGITFVVDIMDWFEANRSINSKIKQIDNNLRIRILYPNIKNKIYICSAYENILGVNGTTVVIPGVTEVCTEKVCEDVCKDTKKIKLLFAGAPGKRCEKEKIDWVIKAINHKQLRGRFLLHIAGVSKEEFVENNAEYASYLSEDVVFLGKIPHSECINYLLCADFSLIIRPNTRLSNFGFSTKMGEAFRYGIPVLATDTSDNKMYISDGENGFVCECSYEGVYNMLLIVSRYTRNDLEQFKNNIKQCNPLSYKNFIKKFSKVI